MTELLIPILAFVVVMTIGGAILAFYGQRRSRQARFGLDTEMEANLDPGDQRTSGRRSGPLRTLTILGRALSLGKVSVSLKEGLARAGYHHDSAAMAYLGAKLILLLIGAVGGLLLIIPLDLDTWKKAYLIGAVPVLLFFLPNLVMRILRQRRTKEIRNALPMAVDLVEVCVSAGMGLDTAWNAVSDEIRHVSSTLADEMMLVNLEMQLGAPRTDAMRNMADRTGAQELASMVALLVQTERFGTSIAEALRIFAESMRESRSQRTEEEAEKMAVKLLFPLVFFIFPVMLIVMGGPAGITLHHYIGLGK